MKLNKVLMLIVTAFLTNTMITANAHANDGVANWRANGCDNVTYANTQSYRKALHEKGRKQEAEKLVQFLQACRNQAGGGIPVDKTMSIHWNNEAEHRYNQSRHAEYKY